MENGRNIKKKLVFGSEFRFYIFQRFTSLHMFQFFLFCVSAIETVTSICICNQRCDGCMMGFLQANLNSEGWYSVIRDNIQSSSIVDINIMADDDDKDLGIVLKLPTFMNRRVTFNYLSYNIGASLDQTITVLYSHKDDYSDTSLSFSQLNVVFKDVETEIPSTVDFKLSKLTFASTNTKINTIEMEPRTQTSYSLTLKEYNGILQASEQFTKFEVITAINPMVIYVNALETNSIIVDQNFIQTENVAKQKIFFPTSAKINIKPNPMEFNPIMLTLFSNNINLPSIEVNTINFITLKGNWPQRNDLTEMKITRDPMSMNLYNPSITILSDYIPFHISNANTISINVNQNTTIGGKISSNNDISVYQFGTTDGTISVDLEEITCIHLLPNDGNLNIKVNTFIFLDINIQKTDIYPIGIAISDKYISKCTVQNIVVSGIAGIFSKIGVTSKIRSDRPDSDLDYIIKKNNEVIVTSPFTNIMNEMSIYYYSTDYIHGFSAVSNCLSVDITTADLQQKIILKGSSVEELVYKFCFGPMCAASFEKQLMVNDFQNLHSIFPSFYDKFQISFSQIINSIIDLSALQRTNFEISFISLIIPKPEFTFKFPENENMIDYLSISNVLISQDTLLCAKHIKLGNIDQGNGDYANFSCDTVEFDDSSLEYYNLTNEPQNVILRTKGILLITDNQELLIDDKTISVEKFHSLNIVPTADITLDCEIVNSILPCFNVTFEKKYNLKYEGKWGSSLETEGLIYIDPNGNDIDVTYTTAFIHPNISYCEQEKFINIETDYGQAYHICVYSETIDQCNSLNLPEDQIFENLSSFSTDGHSYFKISISGFTSEALDIDVSSLEHKNIEFESLNPSDKSKINFLSKERSSSQRLNSLDQRLTILKFNKFLVSSSFNITAGTLDLTDSLIECLGINVFNLICEYKFFSKSTDIEVLGTLTVKGQPTDEDITVDLSEAKAFEYDMEGTVNVELSSNQIKINNGIFYIGYSKNTFRSNKYITFNMKCLGNKNIPSISMQSFAGGTFTFDGEDWPNTAPFELSAMNAIIINLKALVTIHLSCTNYLVITALAPICGIRGTLSLSSFQYINFHSDEQSDVNIYNIKVMSLNNINNEIQFKFLTPKINLRIMSLLNTNINLNTLTLFYDFADFTASSLSIDQMTQFIINPIITLTYKEASPSSNLAALNNGILLISAPYRASYSINYILSSGTTPAHGFLKSNNILHLLTNEIKGIIRAILTNSSTPDQIPFYIKIGGDNDEEVDAYMTDSTSLVTTISQISKSIKSVYILLENEENNLKLSSFDSEFAGIALSVNGRIRNRRKLTYDSLGQGINSVTFIYLNVDKEEQFTGIEEIKIKHTGLKTLNIDSNVIISIDPDSLAAVTINNPIDNKVTLMSANWITFTRTGWRVREFSNSREATLQNTIFRQISFTSEQDVQMYLEDQSMNSVQGINIFSSVNMITFNEGWNKISRLNGLKFTTTSNDIRVATISIPIPSIFDANVNIIQTLENLDVRKHFSILDQYQYNGIQIFDLTNAWPAQQFITGKNLVVDGESTIGFVNDIGNLYIETLKIDQPANVIIHHLSISKSLEMEPNTTAVLEITDATDLSVKMHWDMNNVPSLSLGASAQIFGFPSDITFTLDDDFPNYTNYYHIYKTSYKLITGNFPCDGWLEKLTFRSQLSYFSNTSDLIFDKMCETDTFTGMKSLVILAERDLPHPEDSQQPNEKVNTVNITAISIAVFIVVAVVVGVTIYCVMRKRYEKLLKSKAMKRKKQHRAEESDA